MREFTSKPDADKPDADLVSFVFKLDDEQFTVRLKTDADSVLEWSELVAGAYEVDAGDVESPEVAAYMARFFKAALGGEYRRFRAHLKAHKAGRDVLLEIMSGVSQEMENLVTGLTDRPTQPSPSSSGGPEATDERRLQVISLAAAGDVEFAAAPPPGLGFPAPGTGLEPIPSTVKELGPKGKKKSA